MLQRDYIMRLIQEFMVAIQKFLEKAEGEDQDLALRDLYRQYVGDYDTLRNLSVDEFDYVDAHDTTFNLDRQQKMVHIQQMLHAKSR